MIAKMINYLIEDSKFGHWNSTRAA